MSWEVDLVILRQICPTDGIKPVNSPSIKEKGEGVEKGISYKQQPHVKIDFLG